MKNTILIALLALASTLSAQCPTGPTVLPLENSGGTGPGRFAFIYSGPYGYGFAYALINGSLSAASGCVIGYSPDSQLLYLMNDGGNGWLGPIRYDPATPQYIGNSQCEIGTAGASPVFVNGTLRVNLNITFRYGFPAGTMRIWQYLTDQAGNGSGWSQAGVWTTR
jgi:hypothetical protein